MLTNTPDLACCSTTVVTKMELFRSGSGHLEARFPAHFPFQLERRVGEGRCLVATREIRPEETVLTDSAIILGRLDHGWLDSFLFHRDHLFLSLSLSPSLNVNNFRWVMGK